MKRLKKVLLWICGIAAVIYIGICAFFFAQQKEILFLPDKLPADYKYSFENRFKEYKIVTTDGKVLSGLLFGADSAKGLIFYVHGNAGALHTWGESAKAYTALGYDIFMFDYRGYGKSEGQISTEAELFEDVQIAYDTMRKYYPENKIAILGYSIGTGPAAMLAAHNHPAHLMLQAPYYSMVDMMEHTYPFLPRFLLQFPLNTAKYIAETAAPVTIFHGTADGVLYYGSSLKLQKHFKAGDTLITIDGLGHNGFTKNRQYLDGLKYTLENPVTTKAAPL